MLVNMYGDDVSYEVNAVRDIGGGEVVVTGMRVSEELMALDKNELNTVGRTIGGEVVEGIMMDGENEEDVAGGVIIKELDVRDKVDVSDDKEE